MIPDHAAASNSEANISAQNSSEDIQALNRQAVDAFINHRPGVEEMCQRILTLCAPDGLDEPRDIPGAAEALRTLGRYFMARSDYGKALDYFQKSLRLCQEGGIVNELPTARSYVGVVFTSLGDYSRAAELLREAHSDAEAIGDALQAAEVLNDLSYTYVMAGKPEMALVYLQESITVFRELGDDMRLSWALESLGQAYLRIGRKEEALACVQEGLNLAHKHEMWIDVTRFSISLGEMYRALAEPDNAMRIFQEALELSRRYTIPENECHTLLLIAEQNLIEGQPAETLSLVTQAERIASEAGLKPHLRQCCLLFSQAYKALGDFQQALAYHEKFYEIDKEIFNAETDQRLRNVQALYQLDTAKKEAELYQLRAQALQLEVEERRRTEVTLKHMASTDPLTDLLNRRAFFILAEKAFSTAKKSNGALSIILIDIDHFKNVNDHYGHLVGDHVLTQISARLRDNLRAGDHIARYGGEEFIILLEGVTPAIALIMAERLRLAVADSPLPARGVLVPATISLGVAGMEPEASAESLDQLIAQADSALYSAKRDGRNTARAFNLADLNNMTIN